MAHLRDFKWDTGAAQLWSAAPCVILWLPHLWEYTQVSLHEGEQNNWIP